MRSVADALTAVTAVAFVALALGALVEWVRHRDRRRVFLALALAGLAVVAGGGQLIRLLGLTGPSAAIEQDLAVVAFLASGYCVLLFRHSFIAVSRRWLAIAAALALAVAALGVIFLQPGSLAPLQRAASLLLIVVWAALIGEPIVRFWAAGSQLPRVQRQRMRALSTGFAVLVAILVASAAEGPAAQDPIVRVVTQAVALAMVPVFWVSIAPPSWLRRQWRAPEENELRHAITDLLIFSPGRVALAEKGVRWAARLVGGAGAFLVDASGAVLAAEGVDAATREAILAAWSPENGQGQILVLPDRRTAIVVPLPLEDGPGLLAVLGGPFTPVFASDEVLQLAAYASSVTAGLERARVTERLAAMERTKTQFLNLASHELRGPLTVIRGYLSMLEHGSLGKVGEDAQRAVEMMSVKATEMNSMVEQMLEAARLEEGRLELHIARHDLRDVVRQSIEVVRPLVDAKHPIRIAVPRRPVTVECDADRIQTILTNLLDNAVKYSPAGGEVAVEVASGRDGPAVHVRDHGVGIAPDSMSTLVTRFGRIAGPDTSHLPGTGLGLYLSRELARLHGGDITVESRPGNGSTFTLRLPVHAT